MRGQAKRVAYNVGMMTTAVLLVCGVLVGPVSALVITSSLTGDGRSGTWNDLLVNVRIQINEGASSAANLAAWSIDVSTTNHTDVKLDEFYFNMASSFVSSDFSFANYVPSTWTITSPAGVVGGGSFSPDFIFEYSGPNVNNLVHLSFEMTKKNGDFVADDFLTAPSSISSDTSLGGGQLGAHLQALGTGGGNEDSAFALGRYAEDDGGDPVGDDVVPEPGTLLLLGSGLLGLGAWVRRRK